MQSDASIASSTVRSTARSTARSTVAADDANGNIDGVRRLVKPATLLGVLLSCVLLSGCWEKSGAICYRPGVYQGAPDPLVNNTDDAALAARFARQTDR